MAKVYNGTDSPVMVDDGVVIGGREHAEVPLTKMVRAHADAGRLVVLDRSATPEPTEPASEPQAPARRTSKES